MGSDLSILSLLAGASLIVKGVMLLLVAASLYSWYLIFFKRSQLAAARRRTRTFEERFWSGVELGELYRQVSQARLREGLEGLFVAGFGEFLRLRQQNGVDHEDILESSHRAMRASQLRELDRLEEGLATLATIGSTSPYIGLFGTVWGIMNSFQSLAGVQQATLAMVAPGIAEALIATAMGLFAAIPAVVAFNRFSADILRLDSNLDGFREEFVNILQRSAAQVVAPNRQAAV